MAHYVIFTNFFKVTWPENVPAYVKTEGTLTEAELYKERFATNPKSPSLPVQKLCPIIWFSQKWWPWPCPSSDCQKKKLPIVIDPEDIICQNFRMIGPAVWSVHREKTDRQTDKQTNRQSDKLACDQYTLRKSEISQSNKQTDRQTDKPRWPIYFSKIEDFEK